MIAFKSCPRCHGDLLISKKSEDVSCLQCGYELKPEESDILMARIETRARRLPIAA